MNDAAMRGAREAGWPEAVIFDLDGTLVDSAPDLAGALNTLLQSEGHAELPEDDIRLMIGGGVPKLIARGLTAHGIDFSEADIEAHTPKFLEIYAKRATEKTRLYPGGLETLQTLQDAGKRLGICTNKPTEVTLQILEELDVAGYFVSVIGGTSGYARKPDPGPMHASLSELSVGAEAALMVGDSPADVGTARAVGVTVVAMSYGYSATPAADLGADLVLDHLGDVPEAIRTLSAV